MHAGASPLAPRLVFFTPLLLAVVTAVALLVVPTGREESVSVSSSGETTRSSRSTTLVQSDGWGALVPLAIPVLLAGVPPAFRRSRWRGVALAAASVLLLAFVVLSAASIGLFYLPVAGTMVAAAIRGRWWQPRLSMDAVVGPPAGWPRGRTAGLPEVHQGQIPQRRANA